MRLIFFNRLSVYSLTLVTLSIFSIKMVKGDDVSMNEIKDKAPLGTLRICKTEVCPSPTPTSPVRSELYSPLTPAMLGLNSSNSYEIEELNSSSHISIPPCKEREQSMEEKEKAFLYAECEKSDILKEQNKKLKGVVESVRRYSFGTQLSAMNRSTDESHGAHKKELNELRCNISALEDAWRQNEEGARGGFGRMGGDSFLSRVHHCHV